MIISLFVWTVIFAIGVIVLLKGADFLVDGGGKIAIYLGVPAVIVGVTLVSFGTSLPELASSLSAALKGRQGISVGNVVGSNIANVLLVLGVSALIRPISLDQEKMIKREIPLMFGAMALLAIVASTLYSTDHVIERWEGILLLLGFIAYIVFFAWTAVKNTSTETSDLEEKKFLKIKEDISRPLNVMKIVGGILGIAIGSEMMVRSAIFYMNEFNLLEGAVGLTILAFATSVPELATSGMAAFKGETDISLGNVVGSNTFNILMVIGICAAVTPLTFSSEIYPSFLIMIAVSILLTLMIYVKKRVTRLEGVLMLGAYLIYVYYMIIL